MKPKVAVADRSPHGWWIASYIERAVFNNEAKPSPRNRCIAWENTIILKAPGREAAYKKAVQLGSRNHSKFEDQRTKRQGHWEFVGLTSLLPIYEALEDGAEILWTDLTGETLRKVLGRVKQKRQLEIFTKSR